MLPSILLFLEFNIQNICFEVSESGRILSTLSVLIPETYSSKNYQGKNIRLFLGQTGYNELKNKIYMSIESREKGTAEAVFCSGCQQLIQTIMVIPFTDTSALLLMERPLIITNKQDQF